MIKAKSRYWVQDFANITFRMKQKEGLSFIEIMVSMCILSVAIIPLITTFMGMTRSVVQDRLIILATAQAEGKIEEMKNQAMIFTGAVPTGYNNLAGGTDTIVLQLNGTMSRQAQRTWTVVESTAHSHKTVTVWIEDVESPPAFPRTTVETTIGKPSM